MGGLGDMLVAQTGLFLRSRDYPRSSFAKHHWDGAKEGSPGTAWEV